MYNPYQQQGMGYQQQQQQQQQQPNGFYPQQQQGQSSNQPQGQPQPQQQMAFNQPQATGIGGMPQSFGNSFSSMPQQPQTGYNNNGNNGSVYGNGNFGQQPQQQQQQVKPQHTGYVPNSSMPMMNTTGTMPPPNPAQQPQLQSIQPQGTGYYQAANTANVHSVQPLQSQGTGYYVSTPNLISSNQTQQPLQAQGTGYYQSQPQQVPPPQQAQSLQPLKPQQTGFYLQPQNQAPLEPLKPTATGFVNSFANNGLNNDIKIPAIRLSFITAQDQAKFETLFRSIVTNGSNTVSGANCRKILMRSGLPPSQLARIWTLCDTSKAGELLFPEFALAMHLINDVLQGDTIPYELDSKTKNEVSSFIDAINLSIANQDSSANDAPKTPFDEFITAGVQNLQPQPTGYMPQTSFGIPLQSQITGGGVASALNPQSTGFMAPTTFNMSMNTGTPGLNPQITGGAPASMQPNITGNALQPQTTGMMPQTTGMMPQTSFGVNLGPQLTGGALQSQYTGGYGSVMPQQSGPASMPNLSFNQQGLQSQLTGLQPQPTGFLPPSNFSATMPLTAQKTGFGNNEIYTKSNFNNNLIDNSSQDKISTEEKSLFYKIFETFDTQNKGLLDSPTAVEIFRKSGLNRADLEQIWNLCDINNTGQLNKQEFALGMHLVYGKLNGKPIPNVLPSSLIPSSTKLLDNLKNQLKTEPTTTKEKPSFGKIDALSYKNNDDDVLPNYRNRRKVYSAKNEEQSSFSSPSAKSVNHSSSTLQTDDISVDKTVEKKTAKPKYAGFSREINLKNIASLENEIKNISNPENCYDSSIPSDLTSRFDAIIAKLPNLFNEISTIDNEITNAKIQLYRKKNPSSIIGSGPNGEITENDRKKAKSRALLRARMSALTGKSTESEDSLSMEDEQQSAEIKRIQQENGKNQEIIKDIRSSISDISASLKSTMTGSNMISNQEFERWEFGIGLEDGVREFLDDLKSNSNKSVTESSPFVPSSTPTPVDDRSSSPSYSQFKTAEERAAYLKEQAKKRMKEKLAKFDKNRRNVTQSSRSISSENSREQPQQIAGSSNLVEPRATPFQEEKYVEVAQPTQPVQSTQPVQPTQPVQNVYNAKQESDDEDEDDEEKRLQEELKRLKLKKKADKEKRLAALRKQIEDAQNESDEEETNGKDNFGGHVNVPQAAPVAPSAAFSQNSTNAPRSVHAAVTPAAGKNSTGLPSTTMGHNPYFKDASASSTSTFDARAAEMQRRIQRGLDEDEDDGWSDEDESNNRVAVDNKVEEAKIGHPDHARAPPVTAAPLPSVTPVPPAVPVPQANTSNEKSSPIPIAPIPPSVTQEPPVPLAPPLPAVDGFQEPPIPSAPAIATAVQKSGSSTPALAGGVLPPPPPLPTQQASTSEPIIAHVDNYNGAEKGTGAYGSDSDDDVLSIPESVGTDEEEEGAQPVSTAGIPSIPPAGIPPPPPLP